MRHLCENSHLKHNNSNEEYFFIMFLTLSAMPGHFWEQCQVGVSHKSGEMCQGKWMWILYCKRITVYMKWLWLTSMPLLIQVCPPMEENRSCWQNRLFCWMFEWYLVLFSICVWALQKCYFWVSPAIRWQNQWTKCTNSEITGTSNN